MLYLFRRLLAVCLTVQTVAAYAGLTIAGSRIIFDEAQGEIAIRIQHTVGKSPSLMQVWLDNGDPNTKPAQEQLPFLLSPVVARLNPGDVQLVRVLRTRDDLPRDRESMLHINVLEIPATTDVPGKSALQLATQARLKFFYRPKGLTPSSGQAFASLRFTQEPVADDGKLLLRVHNASPYHVTVRNIAVHAADDTPALASFDEGKQYAPVLAPMTDLVLPLTIAQSAAIDAVQADMQVRYTVINDQGGNNVKFAKLDRAV